MQSLSLPARSFCFVLINADRRALVMGISAAAGLDHAGRAEQGERFSEPIVTSFLLDLASTSIATDCMDELTGLSVATPAFRHHELKVSARADVVRTCGVSLCEAKRGLHARVHCMPSGVELEHFHRTTVRHSETARRAGTCLRYRGQRHVSSAPRRVVSMPEGVDPRSPTYAGPRPS